MHHTKRTSERLSRTVVIALVAGLCVTFSADVFPVRAQQAQPAQPAQQSWLRVDTLQVKPELWEEFRQIERDEVIPALRGIGIPSRSAWRTAEFGSTFEVLLVRPIADFAEYDRGDTLGAALGPRQAERQRERWRRTLVSRDSAALLVRADLSVGETSQPFIVQTTVDVAPGRGPEYEQFLRETLPSMREAGANFGIYQRVYGQPTAWILVQNFETLSELGRPGGLFRAYGEEGAERVFARLAGVVRSVERKVFRFDPELSFASPFQQSR